MGRKEKIISLRDDSSIRIRYDYETGRFDWYIMDRYGWPVVGGSTAEPLQAVDAAREAYRTLGIVR